MTTIEDARATLKDKTFEVGGHPYLKGRERDALMEAADAYALAVLDKAVVGARYTPNSKAKWIVELRQEIEELGR